MFLYNTGCDCEYCMSSATTTLRGVSAGLAVVGFVVLSLFARLGSISLEILIGIGVISFVALLIAGGLAPIQQLLAPGDAAADGSTNTRQSRWWVVRAIAPLEESWNRWSDAIVILGLGVIGIGSFVLLITDQSETPPIGLLFVGFICSGAAFFSLALLIDSM
jgi:hypothetical protein